MDSSQRTHVPPHRQRLELLNPSPWLFFFYWPGLKYRLGEGPHRRAMSGLGISRDLKELLLRQENTRSLACRFDSCCRRLILGAAAPTGLLVNLVLFACGVPYLMAHGILPLNSALLSLLERHSNLTVMAAILALISFGYLAILCRSVYGSFTHLIDAYNMTSDGLEARRQEHPASTQKDPVLT